MTDDDITDSINVTHNLFRMFAGILVEDAMILPVPAGLDLLHVDLDLVQRVACNNATTVAHL